MEPPKQESHIEIKECVIQLERIPTMGIVDDSDSMDLPSLPFLFSKTRKKKKSTKSSAELLREHQSLAQNLKVDTESTINIEETIRRIETVETHETDVSSVSSDPLPVEENDFIVKVFCAKDFLQFFNSQNVTPALCGYEKGHHSLLDMFKYEKEMVSFNRAHLEHVISSFLYSAKGCCISDLKSFVTFLLRTLSVHSDIACISSCYTTLVSLLDSHPNSSLLTFSSAEILMLFLNYGVDIDSFKFLSLWTHLRDELKSSQLTKNTSNIPKTWVFNLKYMLKSLFRIVSSCTFQDGELEKIILFLMEISRDSSLLTENVCSTVRDCIYVCLENIKEETWNKTQCNIVNKLMSMESSSEYERWRNILQLTKSIPTKGKRGIQLLKQISFFSLKCLCLGLNQDLDENSLGFHIKELQFLIHELVQLHCDLLKNAAKFVDNCVKHMDASKEEYNELCNILKHCEASFSNSAQSEKTLFLKIYAKLRTFCGQKISLLEKSSMFNILNIKSEFDSQESSENDYRNNSCYSATYDRDQTSSTPYLSEDSRSCSTNQSDSGNSSSLKENVQIKSEYVDEPSASKTVKKESPVKILIRKKRSSRSSSGNSLLDSNHTNNDLESNDDNLSRQSSEFECKLLSEDSNRSSIAVQNNKAVDLSVSENNFVISEFSVEYPEEEETCCSIKQEIEQPYKQLEIYEVKSIDPNIMDDSGEVSVTDHHVMQPNYELGMPHNESGHEIVAYEGGLLNASIMLDTAPHLISMLEDPDDQGLCMTEKAVSSPLLKNSEDRTFHNNTLSIPPVDKDNSDEDVVFIQETISPEKLSEILPEISITPVKNVRSSVIVKNNLSDNEDIAIIKEKTPLKSNPSGVVRRKDLSPVQMKTSLSPKTKPQTYNKFQINKTHVNKDISTKPDVSQVETFKSSSGSDENSSDSSEIVIVDVVLKDCEASVCDTSAEAESSKIVDKHVVSSDNKSIVNVSRSKSESPTLQCQEVLNSILKQFDLKENTNSQCNDMLNSVLESIDVSVKEHTSVNDIVSNSFGNDSKYEHVASDDNNTHLTNFTSGFSTHTSTVIPSCDIGQRSANELNENITFFEMIKDNIRKYSRKVFNDKSILGESSSLNVADFSNLNESLNIDSIENDKSNSRTDINDLTDNICASETTEIHSSSSQNVINDLQNNYNKISDIINKSLKHTEIDHIVSQTNDLDAVQDLVKSPVVAKESILESDTVKQTNTSETNASPNRISSPFACPFSETSNSNALDNNIEKQTENNLPDVIPNSNDENRSVPPVNLSDESALQNSDKNNKLSGSNTKNFNICSKRNILSVSDQNKISLTCNTKIYLDTLFNSNSSCAKKTLPNRKRTGGSINRLAKKSCKNRLESPSQHITEEIVVINESSPNVAEKNTSLKSKSSTYTSPSCKILKKRSWLNVDNRADITADRPKKYSPMKSPLSAKYSNQKSPKRFFDYSHMRQKYKHFNKSSVLSKEGLNLQSILRKKIYSSTSNQENHISTSDDSDIIMLYTDPKRYADKDCLVIFESQDLVILDD